MLALIAGMVGCDYNPPPSQNLEIRTWYDLDDVRNNLAGNHILMNDLDSTTAGYQELASPTANEGSGWRPIGVPGVSPPHSFSGEFDGQGYEIRDLYTDGALSAGLFGSVDYGGVIKDVGVINVTAIGYRTAGSLVGSIEEGTVNNCYSTGSVSGNSNVGGLVGFNYYGTVSNSYSTGNVTGDNDVGGLVGYSSGTVSDSYSTGNVSGTDRVGGLLGNNYGTVSDSFWDIETSGQATSAGGTGKTTTEMQDIATFSEAGWNITAVALNETNPAYIWNIVDNVTYPFLSWQP
jgi:hypothetical protein